MKQKNVIIAIIAIAVIILIIIIANSASSSNENKGATDQSVQSGQNGVKINTSEKLKETKKYTGMEFSNIKFTTGSSVTNIYADVKNTTSKDMDKQTIEIKVLDKQGNTMTSFTGVIGELKAGETTTLNAQIAADYANAYDIEIVAPSK